MLLLKVFSVSGMLQTSCKNQCITPRHITYSVYYTKYLGIYHNKHGRHVVKYCRNFEFSKKSTKTAGFGKCQQVDLDLVCQKLYIYLGVCKSRNSTRNTRNTRNPPGTPGTPPGTPGTLPGTPGTPPGTPPGTLGTPPGTPGTPPGTHWNTSYEATHVFLYKFTCFALNSGW
jgi:hypothetical protein